MISDERLKAMLRKIDNLDVVIPHHWAKTYETDPARIADLVAAVAQERMEKAA